MSLPPVGVLVRSILLLPATTMWRHMPVPSPTPRVRPELVPGFSSISRYLRHVAPILLLFVLLAGLLAVPVPAFSPGEERNASWSVDPASNGAVSSVPTPGLAINSAAAREVSRHKTLTAVGPGLPNDDVTGPAPELVRRMHRDLLTRTLPSSSDPDAVRRFISTRLAPPRVWAGGLPSRGNPRALVILVDFSDSRALGSQTPQDVAEKMFGGGGFAPDAPCDNLRRFYRQSSYGQLDLSGDVVGWYHSPYSRQHYFDLASAYQAKYGATFGPRIGITCARGELLYDVLNALDDEVDLSRYDSDGDGTADAIFLKYAGEPGAWDSLFWASQTGYVWEGTFDGVRPGKYVFSWYSSSRYDASYPLYLPRTDIHETGHLLGLPDYYDYDRTTGPTGGVGGWDMMDSNWGDHNAFSKYLLGWLTPTILAEGTRVIDLQPSSVSQDVVLVMPDASLDSYAEFFMVEYRVPGRGLIPTYVPVTSGDHYTGYVDHRDPGLVIWHVDARLDGSETNFAWDNSFTSHKLLRLMEADGQEHLEHQQGSLDGYFDTDDLYGPGSHFGISTWPGSGSYAGEETGVTVRVLGQTTSSARVAVGTVDGPIPLPSSADAPRDLDGDGRYEDVNGNSRTDFGDVVLFFSELVWIAANEPVEAFDFNGNGRIDFDDVVDLFDSL